MTLPQSPPDQLPGGLPASALDERIAIVGTSGSGKTYGAKGLVERLLVASARVCIVDPLGVWWGLRADTAGTGPGFPVIVFGGRHGDIPITESMGAALGGVIGRETFASVVDLSELGSAAARRRFMSAFAEAIYEANEEPLHLVLDECDMWSPQRPLPDQNVLLGRIEEIVRRGRVRGFIPWLITQRPAVVHKDVLSQADILIAMKLTASQDRDAIGGWIEGQADKAVGRRILADLPKMKRGEGYVWAPAHDVLAQVAFPAILTFDSSRTPKRGEKPVVPQSLARIDLSAITAALAAAEPAEASSSKRKAVVAASETAPLRARIAELERKLEKAREQRAELQDRLSRIAELAGGEPQRGAPPAAPQFTADRAKQVEFHKRPVVTISPAASSDLHPAARKLLAALAQHSPARFTWGQAATLAGLKPSGGHYNAGRKQLRDDGLVEEDGDLVKASSGGLMAAGEVPSAPSTPAERLHLWCSRLPSPAPEMLRAIAAQGDSYAEPAALADRLGKKPTGGHWNSGVALLRNNGLLEMRGKAMRAAELLRETTR